MDERAILLAATHLGQFRAATLGAYSGASESDVMQVLCDYPDLFKSIAASRHAYDPEHVRWQVVAPERLAARLGLLPMSQDRRQRDTEDVNAEAADLSAMLIKQAQHDLLTLSAEPDSAVRRLKAETAYNFLAQGAFLLQGEAEGAVDWRTSSPDRDRLPARIRLTFFFAELTMAELDGIGGSDRRPNILGLARDLLEYIQDVGTSDDRKLFEGLEQQLNEFHLGNFSGETINVADEPNVPPHLIGMDHAVLVRHVGSASRHTRDAMGQLVVDNLLAWFSGKGSDGPERRNFAPLCRRKGGVTRIHAECEPTPTVHRSVPKMSNIRFCRIV